MFLRKTATGAALMAALVGWAGSAAAAPQNWQVGMQTAASPVMSRIEDFHTLLLTIITAVCLFVAALLIWVMLRYNRRVHPVASRTHRAWPDWIRALARPRP